MQLFFRAQQFRELFLQVSHLLLGALVVLLDAFVERDSARLDGVFLDGGVLLVGILDFDGLRRDLRIAALVAYLWTCG